ncbi:hypothetical protein APHCRT_0088 [Anaplasma phagocytophilum str. CRT53-1]|uniref:Uncharacterized protein n=1 Tax=Anaplasma phagocytophilum str. CRT53-1 TaxID=1359157 RepID=A0A0F3Q8L9_ANAPH|nr:hypothetical protein APHCRT_0088 [Anaplasma phagocytophilum str. CRT53-1]
MRGVSLEVSILSQCRFVYMLGSIQDLASSDCEFLKVVLCVARLGEGKRLFLVL